VPVNGFKRKRRQVAAEGRQTLALALGADREYIEEELRRPRSTRVGPPTVALVILLLLIVYIYAIERVVFRQSRARAAGITTLTILPEPGFALGVLVLVAAIPLGCLYVVHLVLFGQQRAKTMHPAVWLRRMCWQPSGPCSTATPIQLP